LKSGPLDTKTLCLVKYIACQLLVKNYYKHFLTYGKPPAKGNYG
jgi:hypothetical protein